MFLKQIWCFLGENAESLERRRELQFGVDSWQIRRRATDDATASIWINNDAGSDVLWPHQRETCGSYRLDCSETIWFIIRPHPSTTYLDAAYCYRPSSVVCLSVCHDREPAKTAEPINVFWDVDSGGHAQVTMY